MTLFFVLGLLTSPPSFAFTLIDLANHNLICGDTSLRFGPDATIVAINGRRMEAGWGDDPDSNVAIIEDKTFEVLGHDHFTFDGQPCRVEKRPRW